MKPATSPGGYFAHSRFAAPACTGILLGFCWLGVLQPAPARTNPPERDADSPMMLDVSRFIRQPFVTPKGTNHTFERLVGLRHFDGLPFQIEGRGWLYGRREAEVNKKTADDFPDFTGIAVGRAFEELHLLHACRWQEGEGQPIALARINYTDGTAYEWPIKYGAQVRDWQRMPSEERETMSDTNTKVVWRGVPATQAVKSTVRVFKTRFDNPFPAKTVATLDLVSTKALAAYDVVAATVANHDSNRPLTPSVPPDSPDHDFRRLTTIRVVDQNGTPVAGALVEPGVTVDDVSVVALPQYTATNGEAVIRYPGMRTTTLSVGVMKPGYLPQSLFWSAKKFGNAGWQKAAEHIALLKSFVPETNTVTLFLTNNPALQPILPR